MTLPVGGAKNHSPRRILFVAEDAGGGTGNHLFGMLSHWDRARWHAAINASRPRPDARTPRGTALTIVRASPRFNRFPFAQAVRFARLLRSVASDPPDLVHAYFFWSIMYGRVLKSLGRIRFLVENREDLGFGWSRLEYALLRLTGSVPDRVICVSEAVRKHAVAREGIDPARTIVIRNGVELPSLMAGKRRAVRANLGLEEHHLVVGMVANLHRAVKGAIQFLDAIPLIVRAVPTARFLLVGIDTDSPALRQGIAARKIQDVVVCAGYHERADEFYPAMDVSVLTSFSEGLSITLLESMSYRLPVVVTRVGGNPEVVLDGRTGYLVPPGDVAAFVDRVVELLRNDDLRRRMGQEGRARVATEFDLRRVTRRYLQVYEELLDTR